MNRSEVLGQLFSNYTSNLMKVILIKINKYTNSQYLPDFQIY